MPDFITPGVSLLDEEIGGQSHIQRHAWRQFETTVTLALKRKIEIFRAEDM